MSELTERQTRVLTFILKFMHENGSAPTYQEISDAMGFSSPNGAAFHLQALARKGAISIRPKRSRGIVLNDSIGLTDTQEECLWSFDDSDYHWSAPCGLTWVFTDGGPLENNVKFCPSCGKRAVVAA